MMTAYPALMDELAPYVQHKPGCVSTRDIPPSGCTCGLVSSVRSIAARQAAAERRAAEQVEMFERQAATVRHHTARADAAEHQRDAATAALAKFGKHTAGCMAWRTVFWKPPLECDCGLAAALAAPATTEEG